MISCQMAAWHELQENAGKPRRKHSEGKANWPGKNRCIVDYGDDGFIAGNIVALQENDLQEGEPLILPVMRAGHRFYPNLSLHEIRY